VNEGLDVISRHIVGGCLESPIGCTDRGRKPRMWFKRPTHVPDDVYERVRGHFDERELMAVTCAAVATNAWNRLVLSFRVPAGTYKPQPVHA
jgi:hypothetical protein